jgi:hypothetical protein
VGKGFALLCIIAYIPTFCDRRERSINAKWDAFRLMRAWRDVAKYGELTLIRTKALDAAKQYVMGWHPHGIMILSRLAVYGGYFEGKRDRFYIRSSLPSVTLRRSLALLNIPPPLFEQSCFPGLTTGLLQRRLSFTSLAAGRSRSGSVASTLRHPSRTRS